ncbi:MAG: hypothetical protein HC768_14735 [Acaryochloris sp. CRU_2_0]|nr:hypothetical protein [Acaryochloris sp. CRU_2_0]
MGTKSFIPGDKTIWLPIVDGLDYEQLVEDTPRFRAYLDGQIGEHPELFPAEIIGGYSFNGFRQSIKRGIQTRRIRLVATGTAYQIRPNFLMSYMMGTAQEVEKGLYLRRYGVPYEGNAQLSVRTQ